MENKVRVLEIELHNDTVKEAMQKVMTYMQTEPLNIVEFISSDILFLSTDNESLKDNIAQSDLVFTDEKAVLELAGITDSRRFQEAEERLFKKLLLRYFHKNTSRVFLLSDSEEGKFRLLEYLEAYYPGIQVVGAEVVSNDSAMDDMILNSINGVEAECIIAVLPSPLQEAFAVRNRILLNTKLWLGFGKGAKYPLEKVDKRPIREFFIRLFLKREVVKERQKRGNA